MLVAHLCISAAHLCISAAHLCISDAAHLRQPVLLEDLAWLAELPALQQLDLSGLRLADDLHDLVLPQLRQLLQQRRPWLELLMPRR